MKFLPKKKTAFTLVELLVVITIIGMLIAVASASYSQSRSTARDAQRAADLHLLAAALEQYYQDHGFYPMTHNIGANVSVESVNHEHTHEVLDCLVGGTTATNMDFTQGEHQFTCEVNYYTVPPTAIPGPYKSYISKLPSDPLYNGTNDNYVYLSDGQYFMLLTQKYEGNPPSDHRLNDPSCVQPICIDLIGWLTGDPIKTTPAFWNKQYVVDSKNS